MKQRETPFGADLRRAWITSTELRLGEGGPCIGRKRLLDQSRLDCFDGVSHPAQAKRGMGSP